MKSIVQTCLLILLVTPVCLSAAPLNRGLGPEPDSLDNHQAQGLAALQVLRDINEGLVTYDAGGQLVPGAAERWDISPDGREYRFHLRENARWSNGDPVTAEDFLRAWQSALAPASQARTASLLAPLARAREVIAGEADPASLGVSAEDERTLRVNLTQPTPWFLEVLTHPVSHPRHHSDAGGGAPRLSNGAYVLHEVIPQSRIVLMKNPRFHSADQVALESVVYYPIEDPGSELSRYRSGELHVTETIPPGRFEWLQENLPGALRISPYMGSFWLGLNVQRPPLQDNVDLRRALALAIDRETLTRVVLGAGELPAWSVVPPGLAGYQPQVDGAARLDAGERLQRARELYQRAGYGPQRHLRLELRFNTSTQHRRMAVAVSAMWKQALGVRTELIHEEWKVFVNNRRQGSLTQAFRGGWIADYADPVSFLDLFRSTEPLNNTFYANPAYDELLDAAALHQGTQRLALLQQAETLLMRDMPVIPLYYYVSRHLVDPRVSGFVDNPRDVHLSRYLDLNVE